MTRRSQGKRLPTNTKKRWRRRMLSENGRCQWCGAGLDETTATIEHLTPLSDGGTNAPDNLTLACRPCNEDRTRREAYCQ